MDYPISLRRLRQNPWVRELVKEHRVDLGQLIQPVFVVQGLDQREPVPGLPGVYRETVDSIAGAMESDLKAKVTKFLFFFVPSQKDESSFSIHWSCEVVSKLKKQFGKDFFLAVDICLCSQTLHGHCGVLTSDFEQIDNSKSVNLLAELAVQYAQSGADCVAPSDMLDGRVGAIRSRLDQNGLDATLIMSYAAKFHSSFYGPFRLAADCAPQQKLGSSLKDRSTYQIDYASPQDALRSAERDLKEGADILMVKPGLPYLDILYRLSKAIQRPWAVYQVSGEYAALEGMIQREANPVSARVAVYREVWTAFVRAGASMIISYGARFAHSLLRLDE